MQAQPILVTPSGIQLYEINNARGIRCQVINYGARIYALWVPDSEGVMRNVLAGYDTPDGFRTDTCYFNAIVGRVANRIENATFELDGVTYRLNNNEGAHHKHGGNQGFDAKMWRVLAATARSITLAYTSTDGEEHYPGTLEVKVTYTLDEDNGLNIEYEATCDRRTPVNLTNHAYFNLDGDFRTVRNHKVCINADTVIPTDDEFIPHGDVLQVAGTMYDFRQEKAIGRDLPPVANPIVVGRGGYDISYELRPHAFKEPVATARAEHSGILMRVYTDRPCLQFYTGNFLDGTKGRLVYNYQSAFCMEAQDYSNAPNVPTFPSIILNVGDTYRAHTRYQFDVE